VAAALSDDRRLILIHALDVEDPDALVAMLKSRYEAPLLEILPE
jgi:multicomponent K+:H+ antiporter subunit E